MKVVFVYRHRREGGYSIEQLFHTIADELRKDIEVIEYEAVAQESLLKHVWQLRRMQADVYHITGDINYFVLFLPKHKTVLTVHDIGNYLYGLKGIKRWLYKWIWLILPIQWASRVTSVSKATEENIVNHLGIPSRHLTTIENCYGHYFRHVPRGFNADYPTILQVGTKAYKNVPRLIAALRGISCKLILVGPLDSEIQSELRRCGTDYKCHQNLTHAELVQAYSDSDLVTFISIGEGFGVPILEAQASGRPLVTSNIPPMSEVAGAGSCLASPMDVDDIRASILRLITDANYRTQVIQAGLRNAARYSPQAIANQYLTLYEAITS